MLEPVLESVLEPILDPMLGQRASETGEQGTLEQLKVALEHAKLENWMIRLGVCDDVDLDVLGAIAWDDGEAGMAIVPRWVPGGC